MRRAIVKILRQEQNSLGTQVLADPVFLKRLESRQGAENAQLILASYLSQYTQEVLETAAMQLVDFYRDFDEWHCGLNQLKKFHPCPIK